MRDKCFFYLLGNHLKVLQYSQYSTFVRVKAAIEVASKKQEMSVIKLVKVGQPPLTFQWEGRPSLRCQSHSGNSSKNSSILAKAQKKIIGSACFIRQLNQIRLLQQRVKKKLQTCNFLQKSASIGLLIHKRRSLIHLLFYNFLILNY